MNELLQKLLEAEILTEETTAELREAFDVKLEEAINEAKAEAERQVRVELSEQWVVERDNLIEAVDSKVSDFMAEELNELKEDIDRFRDLEAEYAENLIEAKAEMKERLEADLSELVEKLDAFLEMRLASEIDELREDIDQVKKLEFGRKVFEGIMDEFRTSFVEEDSVEAELAEARKQLADTQAALEEAEARMDRQIRESKMEELLKPLSGRQKEIMETILRKIPTGQLEDGYETFIGRVIKESNEESKKEKEKPVLAEEDSSVSKTGDNTKEKRTVEVPVTEGKIVTGDGEPSGEELDQDEPTVTINEAELERIKRLAGIKQ